MRFDELGTKINQMSGHLASNVTYLNESLELLDSRTNKTISDNFSKLNQKVDNLEENELPALKKVRILPRVI